MDMEYSNGIMVKYLKAHIINKRSTAKENLKCQMDLLFKEIGLMESYKERVLLKEMAIQEKFNGKMVFKFEPQFSYSIVFILRFVECFCNLFNLY